MRAKRLPATTINNWPQDPPPTKPYERLAMAILLSAVRDLHSRNALVRLDACIFLVKDAPLYMDAVGLETDTIQWLTEGATQNGIDEYEKD